MKAQELILDILEEQSSFAYTGMVRAIERISEKETATMWFHEGQIIEIQTHRRNGLKALYEVFFQEFLGVRFDYQLEPLEEVHQQQVIFFPLAQIKVFLDRIVDDLEDHDEFGPQRDLKLAVKPEFIIDGSDISELEYRVLELIKKYELVDEIYDKTELLGFEVSKALINLRKMDALTVIVSN